MEAFFTYPDLEFSVIQKPLQRIGVVKMEVIRGEDPSSYAPFFCILEGLVKCAESAHSDEGHREVKFVT